MRVRGPAAVLGSMALALTVVAPVFGQEGSEATPYYDDAGSQLGTILIRGFVDPFTEHAPGSPPAEGQRYAMLTLTFEAAEDQAFATDPYQVQLLDADGYVYYPSRVPRPPEATVPELQSQTLSPFDRVSGVIPYVLPADADVVRIVYRGDGRRMMSIMELGEAGTVAVGEPRTIGDAAGVTYGSVTIREVMDPFVDHEPGSPPPEGQRYVALHAAFEAAEDQAIYATPGSVALVAADGRMFSPTWVPRPRPYLLQDVQSTPLSPGDRVSGFLGYVVPQDVQLDAVVYNPESNRYLLVVEL